MIYKTRHILDCLRCIENYYEHLSLACCGAFNLSKCLLLMMWCFYYEQVLFPNDIVRLSKHMSLANDVVLTLYCATS